jgi:hypothetical protein
VICRFGNNPAMHMSESTEEIIPDITPGERFDRDHIFELDDALVEELRSSGVVSLADEVMIDWMSESRRRIVGGDRALVIRASYLRRWNVLPGHAYRAARWLVQGEGPLEQMNLLTLQTWIVRFVEHPARLVREGDVGLNAAIGERASELGAGTPGRAPFRADDWIVSRCGIESSRAEAEATGFFSGMWDCCSCGLPDDSSTYLWVWVPFPFSRSTSSPAQSGRSRCSLGRGPRRACLPISERFVAMDARV